MKDQELKNTQLKQKTQIEQKTQIIEIKFVKDYEETINKIDELRQRIFNLE